MRRTFRAAFGLLAAAALLPGCIAAFGTGDDAAWEARHARLLDAERRMDAIESALPR